MQDQKIRLQKMLADCGVASRRKAEELIQQWVTEERACLSVVRPREGDQ